MSKYPRSKFRGISVVAAAVPAAVTSLSPTSIFRRWDSGGYHGGGKSIKAESRFGELDPGD